MKCVSILCDGAEDLSLIVAGSAAGKLALWNSEGTFISATKPSERGSVNAVVFDKHGESDVNVKVTYMMGRLSKDIPFLPRREVVEFCSSGCLETQLSCFTSLQAFVGTDENGVMVLEHTKLDVLASLNHHKGGVRGVQGMGNSDTIVSISSDNTIQAWQWKNNKNKTHLKAIQGT